MATPQRILTPCSLRPMQINPKQLAPDEAHIAIILQWSSPIALQSRVFFRKVPNFFWAEIDKFGESVKNQSFSIFAG